MSLIVFTTLPSADVDKMKLCEIEEFRPLEQMREDYEL